MAREKNFSKEEHFEDEENEFFSLKPAQKHERIQRSILSFRKRASSQKDLKHEFSN